MPLIGPEHIPMVREGRKDEARKDFERALEMARKAGDVDLRAVAEQSLRDLDDADDS